MVAASASSDGSSHERIPVRDSEADLLLGLRTGADDYLTEPFSPRELVARIEAILRRAAPETPGAQPIRAGTVVVEPATRRVRRDLSPAESR